MSLLEIFLPFRNDGIRIDVAYIVHKWGNILRTADIEDLPDVKQIAYKVDVYSHLTLALPSAKFRRRFGSFDRAVTARVEDVPKAAREIEYFLAHHPRRTYTGIKYLRNAFFKHPSDIYGALTCDQFKKERFMLFLRKSMLTDEELRMVLKLYSRDPLSE